jgi:ribosome maturation factor RimP
MLKEKVEKLLEEAFEEYPSLFLIEMNITPDNKIKVVIDGDRGVTLKDCVSVSRKVEHNLDREEQDFSLEVASAGATAPIVNARQYNKNKGRTLQVKTLAGEQFEGKLDSITEQTIKLTWKAREPKPIGKGKVTVQKEQEIDFSDIDEAKVIIKF